MEKTIEEIKAMPEFWARVEEIKKASKKIGYPYGGTSPESWVARQVQMMSPNLAEETRNGAAFEAAEEEFRGVIMPFFVIKWAQDFQGNLRPSYLAGPFDTLSIAESAASRAGRVDPNYVFTAREAEDINAVRDGKFLD